jgi:hypothetical protein
MNRIVLTFLVLSGTTDIETRRIVAYFQAHPAEYAESRHRLRVTLERAYLQVTPMANFVVSYIEGHVRSVRWSA